MDLTTFFSFQRSNDNPEETIFQGGLVKEKIMANQSIIGEFWEFLKYRKKYWLLPIVLVLVLLSALIVFTESSVIAPFIYALF